MESYLFDSNAVYYLSDDNYKIDTIQAVVKHVVDHSIPIYITPLTIMEIMTRFKSEEKIRNRIKTSLRILLELKPIILQEPEDYIECVFNKKNLLTPGDDLWLKIIYTCIVCELNDQNKFMYPNYGAMQYLIVDLNRISQVRENAESDFLKDMSELRRLYLADNETRLDKEKTKSFHSFRRSDGYTRIVNYALGIRCGVSEITESELFSSFNLVYSEYIKKLLIDNYTPRKNDCVDINQTLYIDCISELKLVSSDNATFFNTLISKGKVYSFDRFLQIPNK